MKRYIIIYYVLEGEDKGVQSIILDTNLELNSHPSIRRAEKQLERKLNQKNSLRIITYKEIKENK